ncbi:DUF6011 domain-containing protein [Streptomyces sp. NPDC046887]|uniref:DUF6011 domain-containing protein n=1 Tax=Streptomyces sp. NPDC046887 TaxID=3155472 RepID=UPI0033DAFC45
MPGLEPDAAPEGEPDGVRRTVRCGLCGRPLTGADSRRTGLGPACDAKLHPSGPDIPARRRDPEQDTLPGL